MAKNSNNKSRRRRRHGEEMTLADIIRGLQYCVNSSQDIVEQHHINSFNRFFDENGAPLVKTIKIMEGAAMDIPMVCMNSHSSLILDEMEVKLDLMIKKTALKKMPCQVAESGLEQGSDFIPAAKAKRINAAEDQNIVNDVEGRRRRRNAGGRYNNFNINRTSFGIDMISGRADREHAHLGMSMKFKSCNPPEMLSRIIEKLNNAVDVYPTESGKII